MSGRYQHLEDLSEPPAPRSGYEQYCHPNCTAEKPLSHYHLHTEPKGNFSLHEEPAQLPQSKAQSSSSKVINGLSNSESETSLHQDNFYAPALRRRYSENYEDFKRHIYDSHNGLFE